MTGQSFLAASRARNSRHLQPISIITSAGGWTESEPPSLSIDGAEEEGQPHEDDVDGGDGNDGSTSRGEEHAGA